MHRDRNDVIIDQASGASAASLLGTAVKPLVAAVATLVALRGDNKFGHLPSVHSRSR